MAIAVAVSNLKMDPYFKRKVKGPPFKGNEEMHYEGVRLITFKDWPNWGSVWPTVLAKAGFFYTKTADQVACFCCGGRLKTWEAGDSPMTEHKRFFPQCRFVTGQDSTNVPLGEPSVAPSGGHGGCAPTKADYYSELARHAAAGRDQASGPSSLNHLTRAISRQRQPPKAGRYASLQCSAMKDAPSVNPHSGLRVAIGGATRIDPLTIEQLQEMKLESKRLQSFSNWPTSAYVCPENLAKAGVYYLGLADRVKCAFCNGILRNWKPGDDALEVHRKLFPKCTFLKDAWAAGNMSIEEEKVNIRQASQNAVANPSPSLGVVPAEEPKSLNYSGETSRLLSFRQWPRNSNQTEDDLARAGFYYTGIGDSVKCFSCHGTVRNWEREDDPWTEHARWFPRCNFVRTVKGEAFIRSVQATHSGQTNAVTSANGTNSANTVTQSASKGACRFPVEPRMVRARMDTTRVRSVLDMGFTRDLVYKVIEHHLTTTGDDFPNVQSLLEAVFVAEESLPGSSSSRTKHHRSVATTSRTSEAAKACNGIAASAAPPVCSDKITTTPAGSSGAVASENQTATSANTSPKGKKRRKKNKSAIGNNGTKTSVSAMESSLSHEMKPEVKVTTSENNRLQCKICMDDEAKILFLPCGHLCSCGKCAPALRNCPICRALIRGTVRVYLS